MVALFDRENLSLDVLLAWFVPVKAMRCGEHVFEGGQTSPSHTLAF